MTFSSDTVGYVRESPVIEIKTTAQDAEGSRHKVVITVDAKSQEMVDAYVRAVDMLTQVFCARLHPLPADTISTMVALMVPKQPVPSTLLREARMLAQAKTELLQSNDWVTANEISHLAQYSSRTPSSQPNKWKRDNRLFAIRHNCCGYFPVYGLDKDAAYRPLPAMREVIKILEAKKSSWGMAYWFASVSSLLGGKRPQDLLVTDSQRVIEVAKDGVAGITHG